jgi:hypothetical protein
MAKIFLSHSARDADLADAVARAPRKHGVEPVEVPAARNESRYARQATKSAIRRADGFVLISSAPDTASTGWATYELGLAEALDKPILLLLSRKHAIAELPQELAGLPVAQLRPSHPERAAHEVLDRLLAAARWVGAATVSSPAVRSARGRKTMFRRCSDAHAARL